MISGIQSFLLAIEKAFVTLWGFFRNFSVFWSVGKGVPRAQACESAPPVLSFQLPEKINQENCAEIEESLLALSQESLESERVEEGRKLLLEVAEQLKERENSAFVTKLRAYALDYASTQFAVIKEMQRTADLAKEAGNLFTSVGANFASKSCYQRALVLCHSMNLG